MKVMDHPVFRRFWYPVIPMAQLESGPQRAEVLGQGLVVFLDEEKRPAALEDRCCHRTARLSLGDVCGGTVACPYHGWRFDRTGQCVFVPQLPDQAPNPLRRVRAFHCQERYGYAWVALEEPLFDIPRIPEADDPDFHLMHEFFEEWKVSGLRVMENELDTAHPSYVHLGTFGSQEHLQARDAEIEEFENGFHFRGRLGVEIAHHDQSKANERILDFTYFMPFMCRLRINYPDGPAHVIVNCQVPLDNERNRFVQFCFDQDLGQGIDREKILAFDRKVTLEDKRVLESCDPDVPLDPSVERHMPSDRPGLMMRKMLQRLIEQHEGKSAAA